MTFNYFLELMSRKDPTCFPIFGYFHDFITGKEWTYFSIFAIYTNFRQDKNELIGWFKLFSRHLRPEKSELITRFLAIFMNFWLERNELITRVLAIFMNLSPDKKELIARFLAFFPKRMNLFLDVSLFSQIWTRREWTYCSIFGHFHEFLTRNKKIARFLAIFSNLRKHQHTILEASYGNRTQALFLWREQLEDSLGLLNKMTLSQTINTTDLQLHQLTSEQNSLRNVLTKTEAKLFQVDFPENSWFS